MGDAVAYDAVSSGVVDEPPSRDGSKDASRTSLERSRGRLDITSMSMDRREFAQLRAEDSLDAINLFSDASPVVGSELQGMVMELMLRGGFMRRRTLPGSTLAYGHTGWVNKAIALVWAVFLVVGPEVAALYFFFDHVRSLTNDYGVELTIMSICNVIPAF